MFVGEIIAVEWKFIFFIYIYTGGRQDITSTYGKGDTILSNWTTIANTAAQVAHIHLYNDYQSFSAVKEVNGNPHMYQRQLTELKNIKKCVKVIELENNNNVKTVNKSK